MLMALKLYFHATNVKLCMKKWKQHSAAIMNRRLDWRFWGPNWLLDNISETEFLYLRKKDINIASI